MIRLFGLLLSCGGALFLGEHYLTTAQPFTNTVDLRTIDEDINNGFIAVTECFFILFGLVLFAGNFKEKDVHQTVIKHRYKLTEIEASTLVRETNNGSFELDDSAVTELAIQYQAECPHRNVEDIISLKGLEIAALTQLLPSEVRPYFEPLLKAKLDLIDETMHQEGS